MAKLDKVITHIIYLLSLRENNRIIVFSNTLSRQIPKSYAAHAFNLFKETCYRQELIRLAALWDVDRELKCESIPVIVDLIKEAPTTTKLRERLGTEYIDSERADGAIKKIQGAIDQATKILNSEELIAVTNHRHKYLAHSLPETRIDKKGHVSEPKYGDEEKILNQSLPVMDGLLIMKRTCVIWTQYIKDAARCANDLWGRCKFDLAE